MRSAKFNSGTSRDDTGGHSPSVEFTNLPTTETTDLIRDDQVLPGVDGEADKLNNPVGHSRRRVFATVIQMLIVVYRFRFIILSGLLALSVYYALIYVFAEPFTCIPKLRMYTFSSGRLIYIGGRRYCDVGDGVSRFVCAGSSYVHSYLCKCPYGTRFINLTGRIATYTNYTCEFASQLWFHTTPGR
mgnify:CR=1 FL=1